MSEQLARRGPDPAGTFADGPLAFGHRRLAIIELSPSADQLMVDTGLQLALVFNGTIYNYRKLRTELVAMGYAFFSEGDSEVILKAYHAWGEPCVQRFCGMFAFAIWDTREGHRASLFLARDRFGIKPLYLAQDGQRLRFASSLPALLAGGGVDTRLDPVLAPSLHAAHRGAGAAHGAARRAQTAARDDDDAAHGRVDHAQGVWT
jgi:asparagine synthase (glutamine-hydrolysing)